MLTPQLNRLVDDAVADLVASGGLPDYSGTLPASLRRTARAQGLTASDENLLEDLFAERLIELTKNAYVEEITDADVSQKVIQASYTTPVMVDIYTQFCRPCNHVLPVVYLLAAQYKDRLKVVKINAAQNPAFASTYLSAVQVTPAFLFFRAGLPMKRSSGRIGRLLGQRAYSAATRSSLQRRIELLLEDVRG